MIETPVPARPQSQKVESMFQEVAPKYDLANTVLSLGIHHLWRKAVVRMSDARAGEKVLDCATGTGDLAIEFKKAVGPTGHVLGTDFCQGMLELAPAKARSQQLEIDFEIQDVTQLPYANESFDVVSISFGIRNVENPVKGIKEMLRVLKPGGRLMILEFGRPQNPVFGGIYRWYSKNVLPTVGGLITGKKNAYSYLERSSALFPCGKDFAELIQHAGPVSSVKVQSLSFGIAYIYKADKIK